MRTKDLDPQTPETVSGAPARSTMSRLRLLDFDDLFLLRHLLDGNTIAATAKQLGLTQPAITQRVRKIERVFGEAILQKAGRHVRLTKEGRAVCVKAADALALMREVTAETAGEALTVGADPLAYASWLWPALATLREASPGRRFDGYVGASEEVSAMLETGALAAALSTAPSMNPALASIDLGVEEFVMVASPEVQAKLRTPADLAQEILIEIDRSFALLARVESTTRAQLQFRDVWLVGTATHVAQAALAGHGVAVLPERLVRTALQTGRLKIALPEIEIAPMHLRILYRRDRASVSLVEMLAETLGVQGTT